MAKTRIISGKEAAGLLTMPACIEAMDRTLRAVSAGETHMLQRYMLPQAKGNNFAMMGADDLGRGVCGAKIIMFPGQEAKAKGTNKGIVPLFDSNTGALTAIVDAACITAVRTAAASAAATRLLAREDSSHLALLGAGRIGRLHIEAVCRVRKIETVTVWNRTFERGEECCRWAEETFGVKAIPCKTPEEAVRGADIICTVTQAREPILMGEWLKPGAHINAVGACSSRVRELDSAAVARSRVYMDQREAVFRDAGDLLIPLSAGEVSEAVVAGEVGQALLGQIPGRQSPEEITLFESVGISVEDLSAALLIYQKALEQGVGTDVEI